MRTAYEDNPKHWARGHIQGAASRTSIHLDFRVRCEHLEASGLKRQRYHYKIFHTRLPDGRHISETLVS